MTSFTVILFGHDGRRLRRFEIVAWSHGTAARRAAEVATEAGAADYRVIRHA